MTTERDYSNNCFSPNWIEVRLEDVTAQTAKEDSLEGRRRKDLNTLLKEIEDIRQTIEKAAEKQHRLANLMQFYTGEYTS